MLAENEGEGHLKTNGHDFACNHSQIFEKSLGWIWANILLNHMGREMIFSIEAGPPEEEM